MSYPAIFIATHNPELYLQILTEQLEVEAEIAIALSAESASKHYSGEAVLLAQPDFAAAILKNLQAASSAPAWIQSTWAGVTPLIALPNRDYILTGVKEVFGPQMAEYVFAYILAHAVGTQQRAQSQAQKHWNDTSSQNLTGLTLGIMGTGSIGAHVAKIGAEFGMTPIGYNSTGVAKPPFTDVYTRESLQDFFGRSDFVVGILPDVPATDDLINAKSLQYFKKSALLINVGRGNLVDESALCAALENGCLAGAVLDVFRKEPLPPQSSLWTAPNCILTSHVAAVSKPEDIAEIFMQNYQRYLAGKTLCHIVDFEKGY